MALPKSLVNEANQHVSQALQTGARGQTQTTTNYGVIGDAFFKKAQLDLNIANLKADMGYKAASLKSGLEMQIADLDLNAKKLQIETGFKAAEMKAMAKEREVGFMEQLTGALGAGVSGYMAGQNFGGAENGNKYGTMAGIAGAGLTMLSYQSGGRRAGQQSQAVIGNIANMSQSYKQMNDQRIREDAWSTVVKSGADMIAQYNAAKSPEEQLAAMQKLDSHMGEIYSTAMTMPGANPEQVGTMLAQYRKGLEASIGMTGDATKRQKDMAQLRNLVDFRADPRSNDPKTQREWAMDFIRKENTLFEETTGKQMSIGAMVGRAYQLSDEAGKIIESEVKGIGSMPAAATPSMVPQASQRGMMDMAQKAASNVPQQREVVSAPPMRQAPSAPAETERMVGQGGGIPFRPAEGAGIEMDDGMDMFTKPVYAEQKLAEQGAEAVKSLGYGDNPLETQKGGDDGQPKMSMMDKIKHNMSLSDEEFDEKRIPLWEDKPAGKNSKEAVKGKTTEEFRQANAEIDAKIEEVGAATEDGARAKSATKVVDRMIKLVEEDKFPSGSQIKGVGAKIYKEGINAGGGIGAAVGGLLFGGRGAAAGAYVGNQTDIRVGQGAGLFLTDEEENAVNDMTKFETAATMKFAKIQDPTARQISDADAKRFEGLWPRPGQTREQQLAGLLTIKEMMVDELTLSKDLTASEKKAKMDEFVEKERFKTEQQRIRSSFRQQNQQAKPRQLKNANDFIYLGR